jgi:glyoxylase-like metal-dependent hydrolase (beta-lactamase superfamily II)
MQLHAVLGNSQRLDGGAMFGNAPRAMWEKWIAPDAANRIPLACRCLLVRDRGRTILFETGIGAFFAPTMRERYGVVEGWHVLLDHLKRLGVQPEDVDVIVLSHLHFDHAGGALTAWQEGVAPALAFPRAHWVVGARAWDRAVAPTPADRASFIPSCRRCSRPPGGWRRSPARAATCSATATASTPATATPRGCCSRSSTPPAARSSSPPI